MRLILQPRDGRMGSTARREALDAIVVWAVWGKEVKLDTAQLTKSSARLVAGVNSVVIQNHVDAFRIRVALRQFRNPPPNTRKSSALLPFRQWAPNHRFQLAPPSPELPKHPPHDADTDSNTSQAFSDKREQFACPGLFGPTNQRPCTLSRSRFYALQRGLHSFPTR